MADQPSAQPKYFQKNAQEAVGICITEWKGQPRVDVRIYVQPLGEANLVATKKGVAIPVDLFSQVMQGVRDLAEVMGPEKIVARIAKSSKEEIRIGASTFRGTRLIYIRSFVNVDAEGEWKPTRKGVSLRVALYPHLLETLEEVENRLDP